MTRPRWRRLRECQISASVGDDDARLRDTLRRAWFPISEAIELWLPKQNLRATFWKLGVTLRSTPGSPLTLRGALFASDQPCAWDLEFPVSGVSLRGGVYTVHAASIGVERRFEADAPSSSG